MAHGRGQAEGQIRGERARRVYLQRSAGIHQEERGPDGPLEGFASGRGAKDRVPQ